ncbi:hypothetical protein JB92DRAFT_2812906 [Gautieria morchelliformis]|nr:hypothetical protein JB92DRAFT_2812906 [Gautieria morchelliformis]
MCEGALQPVDDDERTTKMPAPNPFPSAQQAPTQPVPALNLFPLNDSFIPKHIHLNQRVKIGRQTNAKTVPGERNGYFDSKVLSRQHAEVWEENGKIYIKDVKSSNGTFINGERLSPESVESEPFELKSDDIVEFGIDIVGEDNKTIIHHKVAARVTCVLSPEDAIAASRDPAQYSSPSSTFPSTSALHSQPGQPNHAQQRRPGSLAPPNPAAVLGSMGAPASRPGANKSGLTFEHILSRLQNGLIQSRETGQELNRLGDQMGDISDTLAGTNPGPVHTYPQTIPPVRPHMPDAPPQQPHPTVPSQQPPPHHPASPDTLASLQSQLAETQSTLSGHVEKIRALERLSELGDLAKEHEAIKREVSLLRSMMSKGREVGRDDGGESDGDDDETRSIATVTPGEDEDAHEEREREREREEEIEDRRQGLPGRPRTPEPSMGNMHSFRDDDDEEERGVHDPDLLAPSSSSVPVITPSSPPAPRHETSEDLARRLATLADQLENALAVSKSLQAQQSAAQTTIQLLEAKVVALEDLVHKANTPPSPPSVEEVAPAPPPTSSPTLELLTEWQYGVEKQWSGVREEWSQERVRLDRAREEWEGRVRKVEIGLITVEEDLKATRGTGASTAAAPFAGLVTPPSPRSLSADSTKPRRRKSRSRSKNGGGRSRSPRPVLLGTGEGAEGTTDVNGTARHTKGSDFGGSSSTHSSSDDAHEELANGDAGARALPLPEEGGVSDIRQKGDSHSAIDHRQRPGQHIVSILLWASLWYQC